MTKWILGLLASALLSLSVYSAPPRHAHPSRVVTEIRVIATREGGSSTYHVTDQAELGRVLGYLRSLDAGGVAPIDPDSFRADRWEFRLTLSDGTVRCYRQLHHSYLQLDGGPWQLIAKPRDAALEELLAALPAD